MAWTLPQCHSGTEEVKLKQIFHTDNLVCTESSVDYYGFMYVGTDSSDFGPLFQGPVAEKIKRCVPPPPPTPPQLVAVNWLIACSSCLEEEEAVLVNDVAQNGNLPLCVER